jgi:hypothetical protein
MAKKRLLASMALAGGLAVGGAAGLILAVPGVSGAQTTTVPNAPSTTAPSNGTTPDRPAHNGNCPNMGGSGGTSGQAPDTSGAATNTGFRHGGGGGPRF